jgi:hypothetical protein
VIFDIARDVGVSLGKTQIEINIAVDEMQSSDETRAEKFVDQCSLCQTEVDSSQDVVDCCVGREMDASEQTPTTQTAHPQMKGGEDIPGQWTLVAKRKKTKSRLVK